jgi:hypothetical protein
MTDIPWRQVVWNTSYPGDKPCSHSGGINVIQLACGHRIVRKWSQGIPHKVRCRECGTKLETER